MRSIAVAGVAAHLLFAHGCHRDDEDHELFTEAFVHHSRTASSQAARHRVDCKVTSSEHTRVHHAGQHDSLPRMSQSPESGE
jgi:hypothetical protein